VPRGDDPVRELSDAQRLAVLATVFDPAVGRFTGISALKCFALGLLAQRILVRGRQVRMARRANPASVAGQGLNLGLRDAYAFTALVRPRAKRARSMLP
jgi:2-octaprenyl-6-methoxyphenol hydroxylase